MEPCLSKENPNFIQNWKSWEDLNRTGAECKCPHPSGFLLYIPSSGWTNWLAAEGSGSHWNIPLYTEQHQNIPFPRQHTIHKLILLLEWAINFTYKITVVLPCFGHGNGNSLQQSYVFVLWYYHGILCSTLHKLQKSSVIVHGTIANCNNMVLWHILGS